MSGIHSKSSGSARRRLAWRLGSSTGQTGLATDSGSSTPTKPKPKTKHSTDVVKIHMLKLKDTRNFIQDVQNKIGKFTRSNAKAMVHARSLSEVFERGMALVAENEEELASCLGSAARLLQRLGDMHAEFCEELNKLVTSTTMNEEYQEAKREKKKYDKTRANYDAAVLKVRSINAKKGQVNLEKLAEAEEERDRLKEVLMLEQVQTGIRLQHTLVKGLMNTADLVWAFAQALDSHFQNCANQLVSSVPDIAASKQRLQTQLPPPPSISFSPVNSSSVEIIEPSPETATDVGIIVTGTDDKPASPDAALHRKGSKDYYRFYRRSMEFNKSALQSTPIMRSTAATFSQGPVPTPLSGKLSPATPSSPIPTKPQEDRIVRQRSFTSGAVPRTEHNSSTNAGSTIQLRRGGAATSSSPPSPAIARLPPPPLEWPPTRPTLLAPGCSDSTPPSHDESSDEITPIQMGDSRGIVRPRKAMSMTQSNGFITAREIGTRGTVIEVRTRAESVDLYGSAERQRNALNATLLHGHHHRRCQSGSGSDRDKYTSGEEDNDPEKLTEDGTEVEDEYVEEDDKDWAQGNDDDSLQPGHDYDAENERDDEDITTTEDECVTSSSREITFPEAVLEDGFFSSPEIQAIRSPTQGFALEFQAIRKKRKRHSKKVSLIVNVSERTISIRELRKTSPTVMPIDSLLQVTKPSSGSRKKLYLLWKLREMPEKFIFRSPLEGERFYQAFWAAKNPLVRPNDAIKPPRTETIDIFIGNWNLGDAPPPGSLAEWIPRDRHDIYVIAVQECKYAPRFGNTSCEVDWFNCVQSHLGPNYIKMAGLSLLSIRLLILVRREHYYKISNIEKEKEATGIANVVGNKGGIGVAFSFYDTSLCFIGAHLAAHVEMVPARNKNYHQLMRGLRLGRYPGDLHHQFDHLFFVGDLNYRIDLPREEVLLLIQDRKWDVLYQHDQLRAQREQNKIFSEFNEGTIDFPPTYRYNRGDRTYSEEKMRVPSFTDRILWKSLSPERGARLLSYSSHDEIMTSDHSPISAVFSVDVLLPPLPDEHASKCVIIISRLRATNIGVHRKIKEQKKQQKQEQKEAKELSKKKEKKEREKKEKEKDKKDKEKEKKEKEKEVNAYVAFCGAFLDGMVKTGVVPRRSDPQWADNDVPILEPLAVTKYYLKRQVLFVAVRGQSDYSLASPDELGQGVLPLWEACRQHGQPVDFSIPLRDKGKEAGTLYGRITVKWEDHRAERQTRPLTVSFASEQTSPKIVRRPSNAPQYSPQSVSPISRRLSQSLPQSQQPSPIIGRRPSPPQLPQPLPQGQAGPTQTSPTLLMAQQQHSPSSIASPTPIPASSYEAIEPVTTVAADDSNNNSESTN